MEWFVDRDLAFNLTKKGSKIDYGIIKEIMKFVGILSSIIGIVGFADILSEISIDYLFEFVLLIVCIILIIIIHGLRHTIKKLTSEYSTMKESYYENLSLHFFTNPEMLVEDNIHYYLVREEHFDIRGDDAFFNFRFQGYNASNSPSRFIRIIICDDSPVQLDKLDLKAIDNQTQAPLEWKVIKDQTYSNVIELYFIHPLAPGSSFDISFSYKFSGSFARKEEYVFYPSFIYKKGTKKLIASLSLDFPPIRYEFLRFVEGGFVTEEQPIIENIKDRAIIKFEINTPKDIYLLKFIRRDK